MNKKSVVLYKILVIGVLFLGVVVAPCICGYNNKSNVQFEKEAPAGFPLNDGLLAYWKFDECSGDTVGDSSGHNYNGKIYGATWIGEYPDCALDFDGVDDYVDFDNYSENLGVNKTEYYIISLPQFKSTSSGGMIYSMSHTDLARAYFNFKLNANGTFSVHIGDETCLLELYTMCSYNDGIWHSAEVKYYGNTTYPTLEIYVDDELDGSVTKWLPPFFNYDYKTAKMGRKSNEEIDYFDGLIDEVKIYKWPTNPPTKPTIEGPNKGNVNTKYNFEFTSTDPQGQDLSYYIEWGDGDKTGWSAPRPSGDPFPANHTWTTEDTFLIKAWAKNINGVESEEATYSVTIPRYRTVNINHLFLRFLEQHSNLFPILRYLIRP